MANYFQQNTNGNHHPGAQPPPMTGHYDSIHSSDGGAPHHHPPSHSGNYNEMRPYASLGGEPSQHWTAAAGQGRDVHQSQYNIATQNQAAAFSYARLGEHGPMNMNADSMYSRGNYGSMPEQMQMMNGANTSNDFKYRSLGNDIYSQQVNTWNHAPQQQQQQEHQQHYHPQQHDYYHSQQYGQNQYQQQPLHQSQSQSFRANNELKEQRPPPPVEMRPPMPPPLPTDNHNRSSNAPKRASRWGGGGEGGNNRRGSVSGESNSSNNSNLKKPPPLPSSAPTPPLPPPPPGPPPPLPNEASKNANSGGTASTMKVTVTDSAVNAINALSNLQQRWGGPGGNSKRKFNEDPVRNEAAKRQKRKRQRKRRAEKRAGAAIAAGSSNGNGGSSLDHPVVIRDPDEKKESEWIDVEDEPLKKQDDQGNDQKVYDLTGDENDFPPLASQKKLEGAKKKDDPRLVTLEDVSTLQLTSYAAVLERALDQKKNVVDTLEGTSKNYQEVHSLDDDDEEMDISDDEEEVEVVVQPIPKSNEEVKVQELPPVEVLERSPNDVRTPTSNQAMEPSEKEKRSLKLAELRAKAKLARAKLRIAEQKKARGTSLSPVPPPPAKKPILADIKIGSLVIENVGLTGPDDEVRFVDSVYNLEEEEEEEEQDATSIINSTTKIITLSKTATAQQDMGAAEPVTGASAKASLEEKRKKTESLQQQLQLRRLQLEIMKKKKEALEKKKKRESLETSSSAADNSGDSSVLAPKGQPLAEPLAIEDASAARVNLPMSGQGEEREISEGGADAMVQNCYSVQDQHPDRTDGNARATEDVAVSQGSQKRAKLDQLIRRQKELKQKNEIANLRNLIHRQRDLLQAQGKELTDSSTQLQSCVKNIQTKQELLDQSEQKLEELKKRKRRMERMVLRATEQLMTARKALGECQR